MADKAAVGGASTIDATRKWLVEHKLRAVGTLWATSLVGSFAYNFTKPHLAVSVKLIHARIHAQALTLVALLGAAGIDYYEHNSGAKVDKYEKHFK